MARARLRSVLPALGLFVSLGVGACDDKPAPVVSGGSVPAANPELPLQKPGPTRYEISSDGRRLGVATEDADGIVRFEPDADLPSPCYADDFEKRWAAYAQPDEVRLDVGGVEPDGTRWHGAQVVERGTDLYPYAMLDDFLGNAYGTEPSLPRSLEGKVPTRFEVSAYGSSGETPENFTRLPVGVFTIAADGTVTLQTACEGEYLARRLAEHFAQDVIEVPFAEPGGKWSWFQAREPGDLRLTTEAHADLKVRYQRGEPEFFAALMTIVDHQFYVDLDVEPAPVLAASALER